MLNYADLCSLMRMHCAGRKAHIHDVGGKGWIMVSKIKSLRLEAKLSLNQLARLADLDRATVSKAEKGGVVSELTLHKIAATLGRQLNRNLVADELVSQ